MLWGSERSYINQVASLPCRACPRHGNTRAARIACSPSRIALGRAAPSDQSTTLQPAVSHRKAEPSSLSYSELSLLTGLTAHTPASSPTAPLPPLVGEGPPLDKAREPRTANAPEQEESEEWLQQGPAELQPVFRYSPFDAESSRHARQRAHASILFVDEGDCCRSVLAEAMFNRVVRKMEASGRSLPVKAESASLGPAFLQHDPRVQRLAHESGLQLSPRSLRCFDEVKDLVDYDLVLVMDKFDFEEVMREVAVLDAINPGGFYSARVRQLGHFAAASTYFKPHKTPWALGEGIADPLYGNLGGEREQSELWSTLRKLRLACAGLAQYLQELQPRCGDGMPLQQVMLQALLCPLLGPEVPKHMQNAAWDVPVKGKDWRPLWRSNGRESEPAQVYTIRNRNGKKQIVHRPATLYNVERGYWTDISNLERELRTWMAKNAADQDRLPTNRELRASGANQLCNAIEYHGGFNAVAQKLGLRSVRRHPQGCWSKPGKLSQELAGFVESGMGSDEGSPAPSLFALEQSDSTDLAYAVLKWGVTPKSARHDGLPAGRPGRKQGQQSSFSHAKEALMKLFPDHMQRGEMPSRTEVIDLGHKALAREIQGLGGFKAVAAVMELQPTRAGRKTSSQWQTCSDPAA